MYDIYEILELGVLNDTEWDLRARNECHQLLEKSFLAECLFGLGLRLGNVNTSRLCKFEMSGQECYGLTKLRSISSIFDVFDALVLL